MNEVAGVLCELSKFVVCVEREISYMEQKQRDTAQHCELVREREN